jgi:hypothetical protein
LSVYHWELATCFYKGNGGKAVAKQYGQEKAHTHTLVPKALKLGYHARPNGAASQCHKLVVAVPQLRHYTPVDIAQTDREKSALYSKTAPKDVRHLFMPDRTPKQYEGFSYGKSKSKSKRPLIDSVAILKTVLVT